MASDPSGAPAAPFAVVCCQQGAEPLVKQEVGDAWRLAFSRPGLVTFKYSGEGTPADLPRGIFTRYIGWSLGKVEEDEVAPAITKLVELLQGRQFDQLHVWQRDRAPVGRFSFEPGITPLAESVAEEIFSPLKSAGILRAPMPNHPANVGESVLDLVMVEPRRWWLAWHAARGDDPSTCWPGGTPRLMAPENMISRTYLKTAEAVAWSGFAMRPGDCVVEVGSSPGGSVQRLLELGMRVVGIDPAEMDPRVAEHPQFTHLRARGGDLKRRIYRDARWLVVDSNVRPDKTLTTVRNIVVHKDVSIRGMLLTLKLSDYAMASEIPLWLTTIRGFGYRRVRARQLAFGRTEICVAASDPIAR